MEAEEEKDLQETTHDWCPALRRHQVTLQYVLFLWQETCLALGHAARGAAGSRGDAAGALSKMWVRKWGKQVRTVQLGTACVGGQ